MISKLTASGKNLLLRALTGETINFTKIQLGNGPAQNPLTASALVNPILTAELSKIAVGQEYVTLTASFTNSSITSGFRITEAGFYAQDPDDAEKEILYAIGNEDESTADYVPDKGNRIFEMQFDAIVFVGDAENVSAAISSSLVYVSKEEFDNHADSKDNPHVVTKEQVGLGNVPNVSTNDQTPTFTTATTLTTINSGEKISTLFSKIKLAITKLINHLTDKGNPHGCTASQVGAATKNHTHNAQDINDGVLPIQRGGTGVATLNGLVDLLLPYFSVPVFGAYTGNNAEKRLISLPFTPKAVLLMDDMGHTYDSGRVYGGLAIGTGKVYGMAMSYDSTNRPIGLEIADNGFYVSYVHATVETNTSGKTYRYIAWR